MMRRSAVLFVVAMVVGAWAGTGTTSSGSTRTAICSVRSVTVSFDGRNVVVTSGGKTLARATPRVRFVSGSCRRTSDRGFARALLTEDGARRARITCEGGFQRVVVEVEPVRSPAGRVVGSRLAVWRGALNAGYATGGEIAEGIVGSAHPWFSYYPGTCRPA